MTEREPRPAQLIWRRRPGDQVYHPVRIKHYRLRRVLGVPALYAAGYGNVGSSIYYALGIVAVVAGGATPVALTIAGIFFVFTALTYAEGTAMFPEAGGSASMARHGFNELVGFISGWALMLSYVVTISISAFTIPPYLANLHPVLAPLKESEALGTLVAIGLIVFLAIINVIGVRETSFVNISAAVVDVATQASIVVLGFALLFHPVRFFNNVFGDWPALPDLIFGIALAAVAYTGVETVAQLAEETRQPGARVPRALVLMLITVLFMFSGISTTALSAMPAQDLATTWARDPVAGIAANLPEAWLRAIYAPLVAVLASTILLIATNAGLLGVSRLAFSMSAYRDIPSVFNRIHPRFKTPYVSIVSFTGVAIAILIPGFFGTGLFVNLGGL
ncbi:MAG: APC family permease, partial [Chloroflexi bacterium]|nr:APC family permease [Chloroflexota bacterium]